MKNSEDQYNEWATGSKSKLIETLGELMQPLENVDRIPMAAKVSVGFGSAFVTKDNECFWYQKPNMEYDSCISMAEVEAVAANFPDSDWRVHLCGPLSEIHYQRQGKENWVAYELGPGFA